MIKIIFLDVDGVLNSENYYERNRHRYENYKKPDNALDYLAEDIDPECIKRLQHIIDKTNAKIVLSSTWRLCHYDDLKLLLKRYNFTGEVIDKTPCATYEGSVRGNEILLFMQKNAQWCDNYRKYKDYVIIDDDSDMLYCQKDNFVQTSWKYGLQDEDMNKAIEILNQGE